MKNALWKRLLIRWFLVCLGFPLREKEMWKEKESKKRREGKTENGEKKEKKIVCKEKKRNKTKNKKTMKNRKKMKNKERLMKIKDEWNEFYKKIEKEFQEIKRKTDEEKEKEERNKQIKEKRGKYKVLVLGKERKNCLGLVKLILKMAYQLVLGYLMLKFCMNDFLSFMF